MRYEFDYAELARELDIRGQVSSGQLYARCPLHSERHPSFSMNVKNGLWYCHTENRGGNFVQLVSEVLGMDTFQARMWMIDNATKVVLPEREAQIAPEEPKIATVRIDGFDRDSLPDYWFERGFDWQDADRWDIRYDRRRRRLIIPHYFPLGGELVGYLARTVVNERPKYLNSPDFPRKETLYGYSQATSGLIIITEGTMNVIRLSQYGIPGLATFGANITDEQLRLIAMLPVADVILALDVDEAGRSAECKVEEYYTRAKRYGLHTKLFDYPQGRNDIAECSAEEVERGIANATPIALGWSNIDGRLRRIPEAQGPIPKETTPGWAIAESLLEGRRRGTLPLRRKGAR